MKKGLLFQKRNPEYFGLHPPRNLAGTFEMGRA